MAALAGGIVALVLGIIGIIVWWGYFLKALLAAVPAMLILGGALAAYLGFPWVFFSGALLFGLTALLLGRARRTGLSTSR